MALNGIDISSWQAGIDIANVRHAKFVVVKATESTSYVNAYMPPWAEDVLAAGKRLGLYHFARPGDAIRQAKFFLSNVKKWYGKMVPCLDWEEDAVAQGPEWALTWLDYVYAKTGAKGFIYMSKSVCNAYDWRQVVESGYLLWVAQYPNYDRTGFLGIGEIWTDGAPFGAWGDKWPDLFQYTSAGRISGYDGNLDLDLFNGTAKGWDHIASGSKARQAVSKATQRAKADASTPKWMLMVDEAVRICNDDSHGYSQSRRWSPDYDCSSLMFHCADIAGYGVDMHDPRYTGSMIPKFTACGFTKMAFDRSKLAPGDVLLSHNSSRKHTELYIGDGKTAGAHIAETGGIDGKAGDQTGNEISVAPLSWTPQWILRPPDSGAEAKAQGAKGAKYTAAMATKVRTRRSVYSGKVVGRLAKGETVHLAGVRKNRKGNTWGRITSGKLKGRYVAVQFDGKNRLVKSGAKSVDEIAREVIRGDWGNGAARRDALEKKGYDYDAVQARVDELMG